MSTALVTGASSGIGAEFARQLASQGYDLILVARSQDKLTQLANTLKKERGVKVEIIIQDLSIPNTGQIVYDQVQQQKQEMDLLVNNAGFGDYGGFGSSNLTRQLQMIQLNITTLTELTGLFLPEMQARKKGGIINIASTAAFQPLPYMSVYAATKAFVLNFSEALWAENQETGVRVLGVCPGPTESEFFKEANFPDTFADKQNNIMSLASAADVVTEALQALSEGKASIVTGGLGNQVLVNLSRFMPRDFLVSSIAKQFKV